MLVSPTVETLAVVEMMISGGDAEDLAGVRQNLAVAETLGLLHRFYGDDRCTGFMAWIRLTPEQLLQVARTGKRRFEVGDHTPDAPVIFLMEQLNEPPDAAELTRRMRWLAGHEGVELIAGWRGDRLRMRRVRPHGLQ